VLFLKNLRSGTNSPGKSAMLVITSFVAFTAFACATTSPDAVSRATSTISCQSGDAKILKPEVLLVAAVSKTGGTAKIAQAMAEVFGARVMSPSQLEPAELQSYSLIGFGSGIFDQRHHDSLFELVEKLSVLPGQKVFLFSTSGVSRQFAIDHDIDDPHTPLRDHLHSKGLEIVGEYNCAGFNNNSFLKLFGGMNRGKPDARDIERAKAFAEELERSL